MNYFYSNRTNTVIFRILK